MYKTIIETYIESHKTIDLTNIVLNLNVNKQEPFELYSTTDKLKFFPVYNNIKKAISASPSKSVHLLVPGLMPASNGEWTNSVKDSIYYMPNDSKPHHHGDSPHHLVEWDIDKVFEMSNMSWNEVEGKSIRRYRDRLDRFNRGINNSAIETWINWRIPHDSREYPSIIVKRGSIIWWDFYNTHNLCLVNNEYEYNNNIFDKVYKISEDSLSDFQTLVTIMDKEGTYYFVCSVSEHAKYGHKIKIKVI